MEYAHLGRAGLGKSPGTGHDDPQALTFQTTKKYGHTSDASSHFKIISRTYSVPSTVLY